MTEQDICHVTVDCRSGEVTYTPLTQQELEEQKAAIAAAEAEQQAAQAEAEQLRAAVAAHPDPVVQALVKRAGLA